VKLVPKSEPIPLPRPATDARGVVARFFTDAVSGKPMVTEKWVRNNVPGKRRVSYNRVLWYLEDVQRWLDGRAA
jgi:hypothetical protein